MGAAGVVGSMAAASIVSSPLALLRIREFGPRQSFPHPWYCCADAFAARLTDVKRFFSISAPLFWVSFAPRQRIQLCINRFDESPFGDEQSLRHSHTRDGRVAWSAAFF